MTTPAGDQRSSPGCLHADPVAAAACRLPRGPPRRLRLLSTFSATPVWRAGSPASVGGRAGSVTAHPSHPLYGGSHMPAYPELAARPGRGWWWLILALLLSVGAFVPVAAPIAAPAAVPAAVVARSVPATTTAPDPTRVPGLWMPVVGAVVRGFDARAGPDGAGHRGIDIAAPMGG